MTPGESAVNKYARTVRGLDGKPCVIDVYNVLTAFPTGHPGLDHCVKKILMAGQRGAKSRLTDLREAREALDRAIGDEGNDHLSRGEAT